MKIYIKEVGKDNAKISKPIYNLVKLLTIKFITYIWYKNKI